MNGLGSMAEIEEKIGACRARCAAEGVPFHADALAAALGVSYEVLLRLAGGEGSSPRMAARLTAAVQECTASVIATALAADPKTQDFWVFYLRNRLGFTEKGETPVLTGEAASVTFVREERI